MEKLRNGRFIYTHAMMRTMIKNNINVHVHDRELEHRKMVPSSLQPAQEICTELVLVILCTKSRLRAWHFDHSM